MVLDGRREVGGILHLVDLLEDDEARTALEADLIREGVRLRWVGDGTDRFSWRDLIVLIHYMDSTTNLAVHLTDGKSEWDTHAYMLAGIIDGINAIIWQNGGGKGAKPKPIPRPGSTRPAAPGGSPQSVEGDPFKDSESGTFRGVMTPLDELNEWLGWA